MVSGIKAKPDVRLLYEVQNGYRILTQTRPYEPRGAIG